MHDPAPDVARRLPNDHGRLNSAYEPDATAAEIAAGERERIARLNAGPGIIGPQNPDSPEWQAACDARRKQRDEDLRTGRAFGAKAQPLPAPKIDQRAWKRFATREARKIRRRLRPVMRQLAVEHARARAVARRDNSAVGRRRDHSRAHRPVARRRAGATSSTSSADPPARPAYCQAVRP